MTAAAIVRRAEATPEVPEEVSRARAVRVVARQAQVAVRQVRVVPQGWAAQPAGVVVRQVALAGVAAQQVEPEAARLAVPVVEPSVVQGVERLAAREVVHWAAPVATRPVASVAAEVRAAQAGPSLPNTPNVQ